jgi:hypothetical protein
VVVEKGVRRRLLGTTVAVLCLGGGLLLLASGSHRAAASTLDGVVSGLPGSRAVLADEQCPPHCSVPAAKPPPPPESTRPPQPSGPPAPPATPTPTVLYLTPTPVPSDSPLSNAPPEAAPQLVVCASTGKPGPCPTATPTGAASALAPVAPITGGGSSSSGPSTGLVVGSAIGALGAAALALLAMVLAGRGRRRQPRPRQAPAPAPPPVVMRDDDTAADTGLLSPTYTVSAPSRLFSGHHFPRRRATGSEPPTAAAT